jgi:hypothetical protein
MKKIAITFVALAIAATPAFAANLLTESFAYPDGNLTTSSGGNWATHSGSGTDIQVVSGYAAGDMSQAPDDNRSFAAQTATAKTYACFRVRIPAISGTPRTNYFAHLKDSGTSNFAARVFVAPQGNTFSFGLSVSSSTMAAQWPAALNYDQWYTVVIDYDAAAGTADLWVDPVDESSTMISASGGATGTLISSFALRQSSTGTGTAWMYNVDDIGVGTNFIDTGCGAPTSTRGSTWGRVKTLYR